MTGQKNRRNEEEFGFLLLEAIGEADGRYVLAAAQALEAGEKITDLPGRKRLWRTLLIAAALSTLFVGTAFATGLFGLTARLVRSERMENSRRSYVTQNGLGESPEGKAAAEWQDMYWEQSGQWTDYDLDFAGEDGWLRQVCRVYGAFDREAADKLLEIAEKYGLELYTGRLMAADRDRLRELSGVETAFPDKKDELSYGYVFADGSFKTEGTMTVGDRHVSYTLSRSFAGSLYPYTVITGSEGYEEWAYTNAKGFELGLSAWPGGTGNSFWMYYNDTGRGVYLSLIFELGKTPRDNAESLKQAAQQVADALDIESVCAAKGAAGEILSRDRQAGHNPDAVNAFQKLESSPVWQAGGEFQRFFAANFYGSVFTGVYGREGYGDIDAELKRLSERYALRYAESKTNGNGFDSDAQVYSNGAWFAQGTLGEGPNAERYELHYIPKDALYTCLGDCPSFEGWEQLWGYETARGTKVFCALTEKDGYLLTPLVLRETPEAWIVVREVNGGDVGTLERIADNIDFDVLEG